MIRQELANQLYVTNLQLQDVLHMQLGPITEVEGSIFGVRANTRRPYEFLDDVHTVVSYEFDLNMYRIDREAYNTLDWLGDLGGLKEALTIVLGAVIALFNHRTLENYLVAQLYRAETSRDKASRNKSPTKEAEIDEEDMYLQKQEGDRLDPAKLWCFKERFHELGLLPCFRCLAKSKE